MHFEFTFLSLIANSNYSVFLYSYAMNSRFNCNQHINFVYVIVILNSGIIIVRFHFHVTFETFYFSEWQVITVVAATFIRLPSLSQTSVARNSFFENMRRFNCGKRLSRCALT